jgi:hypothetical protein
MSSPNKPSPRQALPIIPFKLPGPAGLEAGGGRAGAGGQEALEAILPGLLPRLAGPPGLLPRLGGSRPSFQPRPSLLDLGNRFPPLGLEMVLWIH